MTLSVYLAHDIKSVLSCYGSLDIVVDKILTAGAEGLIDIMEKPSAPEKKGGTYYQINIREPNYIALVETYGTKSSRISLRRLLYWFVENEVYLELGWEPCEEFVDQKNKKGYQAVMQLKEALYNAREYIPHLRTEIDEFRNLISEVEEEIWHAT